MHELMNESIYTVLLTAGKSVDDVIGNLLSFSVILIAIGLTSVFYPKLFWHLRIGRKVKGVEPSPLYLWVLRIGGILVLALAAVIIFHAL